MFFSWFQNDDLFDLFLYVLFFQGRYIYSSVERVILLLHSVFVRLDEKSEYYIIQILFTEPESIQGW